MGMEGKLNGFFLSPYHKSQASSLVVPFQGFQKKFPCSKKVKTSHLVAFVFFGSPCNLFKFAFREINRKSCFIAFVEKLLDPP
jgi:hypothetical protein